MSKKIKLHVPNEVRLACLQAIADYLDYRRVSIASLDNLIAHKEITPMALLAVKRGLSGSRYLSPERKSDIENLLDIIHDSNLTVGSLYSTLLQYLDKMQTGWWLFKTSNSTLKKKFYAVINQYDAIKIDGQLIQQLIDCISKPLDEKESREVRYTRQNLSRYEVVAHRLLSPQHHTRHEILARNGDELNCLFSSTLTPVNHMEANLLLINEAASTLEKSTCL